MNYRNKKNLSNAGLQTKILHSQDRTNIGETSEAIFLNSGFCYNDAETAESRFNKTAPGFVYSRYSNPNLKNLENKLAILENGESCCVTASGMSAVFASIMCQIKAGDHLIASSILFGSCHYIVNELLPKYGIEVTLVEGSSLDSWQQAFRKNTKVVFIETPANPNLAIVDIEMIAKLCSNYQAKLIVDNIFASPYCQRPLEFGADIIVYSTTKHLDGQGRTLGGAVIASKDFIENQFLPFQRHTGAALSPFSAWLISKSLETFTLRMQKHCENAHQIAKFLAEQKKITIVLYPWLDSHPQHQIATKQMLNGGAMIAFNINGDKAKTFQFINNLSIIDISNNLGDSKSLITHPATTTHSNINQEQQLKIGITNNLCRLSVGIEDCQDLIDDLSFALSKI
jgi:O-succinylhomoserine sulfhydrylase